MVNLMPLRRAELWEPIRQLQREMEQVLGRFSGQGGGNGSEAPVVTAWIPRIDIEEDEKQYVVKADLPGVDPKDVEIAVVDDALVLRGQKKEEREEKKKDYHRIERFEGQFFREIPLPRGIDRDAIKATTANGVLTITIPKKAEAQPRKITVQAEQAQQAQQAQPVQQAGQAGQAGQAKK